MNVLDQIKVGENRLEFPWGASPESIATLITISMNSSYALFALYDAHLAGLDVYHRVKKQLIKHGMSDQGFANLQDVALNTIPFMLKYGLRANPYSVKDAIAVLRNKDGTKQDTPLANELVELLKNPKATQKEVRAVRAKYPKSR